MLLVQDDHAQVLDRGEQRRARADDDPRLAALDAHPHAEALDIGHAAVQYSDLAEARTEPGHRLGGEHDLRHQQDRAAALVEGGLDRAQVDLCLAAAGDALQQKRAGFARFELGRHARGGLLLVGRELLVGRSLGGLIAPQGVAALLHVFDDHQAALGQGLGRRVRQVRLAQELRKLHAAADIDQGSQQAVLLRVLCLELVVDLGLDSLGVVLVQGEKANPPPLALAL